MQKYLSREIFVRTRIFPICLTFHPSLYHHSVTKTMMLGSDGKNQSAWWMPRSRATMCLPNRYKKNLKGDEAAVNRNRNLRRRLHRAFWASSGRVDAYQPKWPRDDAETPGSVNTTPLECTFKISRFPFLF
jgi:hypothetical protein